MEAAETMHAQSADDLAFVSDIVALPKVGTLTPSSPNAAEQVIKASCFFLGRSNQGLQAYSICTSDLPRTRIRPEGVPNSYACAMKTEI